MIREQNKRLRMRRVIARKILITGGHVTPALAVIEELRKRGGWEISWVGRKYAMEGKSVHSLEYQMIPRLGIEFFNLETGRLQRRLTQHTIPSLLRILPGVFRAFAIVIRIRPHIVLSFGGYISLPVVIAAWFLRIPILVHEQTTTSGLANRIASYFADKIALSFPTSSIDFPGYKVIVTGNPLGSQIFSIRRFSIKRKTGRPLLYVTGGGQGSQVINRRVEEILPDLTKTFSKVIHQTGTLDYEHFARVGKKYNRRYYPKATLLPHEVLNAYKQASLVISRSGANTVSELAALGIPSILIPIPWSERGEQDKNARLLEGAGLAKILPQEELSGPRLLGTINEMLASPPTKSAILAARRLIKPNAAQNVVNLIENLTTFR